MLHLRHCRPEANVDVGQLLKHDPSYRNLLSRQVRQLVAVAAEHVAQEESQATHVCATLNVSVGHVSTQVLSWFRNFPSAQDKQ